MPAPQPKAKIVKDTAERWLLTYADLMNLLLIFFIVLYAMSQVDVAKFNQLADSLRAALGDTSAASRIGTIGSTNALISIGEANMQTSVVPSKLEEQQMEELEEKVNELIDKNNLKGNVNVSMQERGILISITAQLLFKSGSADIEPGSRQIVERIGREVLLAIPGKQIRIEGHTDNDPIRTAQFPSNWELSSARATNLLRILVDSVGIDPTTISSVGYGEFRPNSPNTSEANKAQNRSVDIVILRDKFDKAEAGTGSATGNVQQQNTSGQPGNSGTGANPATENTQKH